MLFTNQIEFEVNMKVKRKVERDELKNKEISSV